ncbi:uncharacterized protein LOC131431746 [Malaya genurostris]|uniref:uncharacterized protein LOC131431746 n=1 Tax=Malaya genurostris TaxID=325434 RepID=UPI0026F3F71F|nr:uncharacterized protein LOC131431746 [Malaya genurostris]
MATNIKIYKICDASRFNRMALPALSSVSSLLEQASITLGKNFETIYIEADGCKIISDLALAAFETQLLMVTEEDEAWTPNFQPQTKQQSALEISGSVFMGSSQDQSGLPEEEIPLIASVTSNTGMTQAENIMDDAEMITVEFTEDKFQVAVQNKSNSNVDSEEDTSDSIEDFSSNIIERTFDATEQHVLVTGNVPTAVRAEFFRPCDQRYENLTRQIRRASNDIENQSPNSNKKCNSSDGVHLQKSGKKHASTEMKFRCFNINWNKISDRLLDRLRSLQEFKINNPGIFIPASIRVTKTDLTALTNAVVDQLRMIDSMIRAETMETVSRQIFEKFPALDYTDDDGFGAGQGYVELKYKMINRNNYLNRFKSCRASISDIVMNLKKKRNSRAGTRKEYWEKTSNICGKHILSKLSRDEPNLMTNDFLLQSQAYVRHKLDEKVETTVMLSQLPVLRRRILLNFHFEKATGVNVNDFRRYFLMKKEKIIQYSLVKNKNLHLSEKSSDYDILQFLCSLVGESFSEIIIHKEIGSRIDDIIVDNPGPVLAAVDVGNDKTMFYCYANDVRLSEGAEDILTGMEDLFTIYFVHNFMYAKSVSKFLELLQEYFFKIITFVASKSTASRIGQRQRRVRKVIADISNFDVAFEEATE